MQMKAVNTTNRIISFAKNAAVAVGAIAFFLVTGFQWFPQIHHAPAVLAAEDDPQSPPEYGLTLCENPAFDMQVVRLAAIGDTKSCDERQAKVAALLFRINQRERLDGVLLLGDNVPGRYAPEKAIRKSFLEPYAPLIDGGVRFYAVLGNHDVRKGMVEYETNYPLLNMNGKRYYSKVFGDNLVEVFFLDSTTIRKDREQVAWLKDLLRRSTAYWRVVAMHNPLYSTAKYHPSDKTLIQLLEPIFTEYRVNLVLSGHNHVYERLYPINGIEYITAGSGGELRKRDLIPKSSQRAAGNDQENIALILQFSPEACQYIAYTPDEKVADEGKIAAAQATAVRLSTR